MGVTDALALALVMAERVGELLGVLDVDAAGEREREGLVEQDALAEGDAEKDGNELVTVLTGEGESEGEVDGEAAAAVGDGVTLRCICPYELQQSAGVLPGDAAR